MNQSEERSVAEAVGAGEGLDSSVSLKPGTMPGSEDQPQDVYEKAEHRPLGLAFGH